MQAVSGPVRYLYLRKARGSEDVPNWPPAIKPLEGPANKVCVAVRLYAGEKGWRAEGIEDKAVLAAPSEDPAFVLTRGTAFGLLQEGRRTRMDVGLLAVRVVNLDGKGVEFATHFLVHTLPGNAFGMTRHPMVVPVDALVLGDYVEHGDRAVAGLDLRVSPSDYSTLPQFLPDDVILREAKRTINNVFQSTARFYSYGNQAKHGISLEVEAGRVSMYGRVVLSTAGEDAKAALLQTPGVVDVADRLLDIEALQGQVEAALDAKGFTSVIVLVEHALVILRGEVADTKTRYQAEDIARGIPGVRGVVNDIVAKSLMPTEKVSL